MDEKAKIENVEANVLYLMTMAMEIILQDCQRRIYDSSNGTARFAKEKAKLFRWFGEASRTFCVRAGQLLDDVDLAAEARGYKDYDAFRISANELARLILLFADRSVFQANSDKVFALLEELEGEDIITEEALKRFYMR